MQCDYYDAGVCRSCTLLATPYEAQLAAKISHARSLVPAPEWLPPRRSAEQGFRTKAKMIVAGTAEAPTLGILAPDGSGVDLQECGLYPEPLSAAFAPLAEFVSRAALEPYDVPARRGELKSVIVTVAPDGRLMVRFVVRSTESLARIRKHLPWLLAELPAIEVASVNLLPEHKAVSEGDQEILLTKRGTLTMLVNDIPLGLRPQSFFQTNTDVAASLYRQVARWVEAAAPTAVWDLYCGVGGFALHVLGDGREVTGVELSEQAVQSATDTAGALEAQGIAGAAGARFIAADALEFARSQSSAPDLVIVNPPRRGIGADLTAWLEDSGVGTIIYSSCNSESLARDLAAMPSLRPVQARVLDMFPHTDHYEVAVLLERGR